MPSISSVEVARRGHQWVGWEQHIPLSREFVKKSGLSVLDSHGGFLVESRQIPLRGVSGEGTQERRSGRKGTCMGEFSLSISEWTCPGSSNVLGCTLFGLQVPGTKELSRQIKAKGSEVREAADGGLEWGRAAFPGNMALSVRLENNMRNTGTFPSFLVPKYVSGSSAGAGLGDQVHGNPEVSGIRGGSLGSATPCLPAAPMQ